jgi:hydrogenase-1 operon protein HyaE
MAVVPMPIAAGADVLASYPLMAQLFSKHGFTDLRAGNFAAFAARPGHVLLLFTEDPIRYKETLDLAVIVPELARAFPGRFAVGVLLPEAAREFHVRYGFRRWPAFVVLKDGAYVGAIDGLRNWDEYVDEVGRLLAAEPTRPPSVGIAVKGPNPDSGGCSA